MNKTQKVILATLAVLILWLIPLLTVRALTIQINALQTQIHVLESSQEQLREDTQYALQIIDSWHLDTFKATAYSPLDDRNGLNSWGDGTVMASGVSTADYIDKGVSVDPDIIPLGSKVYIEGTGWRIATDTGGSIKGYKLDIPTLTYDSAINFGVREVKVIWQKGEM